MDLMLLCAELLRHLRISYSLAQFYDANIKVIDTCAAQSAIAEDSNTTLDILHRNLQHPIILS